MPEVRPDDFKNLAIASHGGGVWGVALNRPDKRNALDIETIEELVRFFSDAPRSDVAAVVLSGKGDHFCAGLDLSALNAGDSDAPGSGGRLTDRTHGNANLQRLSYRYE